MRGPASDHFILRRRLTYQLTVIGGGKMMLRSSPEQLGKWDTCRKISRRKRGQAHLPYLEAVSVNSLFKSLPLQ